MSHLSRDERLLALDGALETARQTHLSTCTACRTEVEALRDVLARVRAVDVPEPSPLFWDHLAARVGEAIAREPAPVTRRGWWSPRLGWAAIAVVTTAAAAGHLTRGEPTTTVVAHVAPAVASPEPTMAPPRAVSEYDPGMADDGWALLTAIAEDAGVDETFAPAVGQAELSISSLSAEERRALARELAAALAPAGVREG
jgi:hypothetical protein